MKQWRSVRFEPIRGVLFFGETFLEGEENENRSLDSIADNAARNSANAAYFRDSSRLCHHRRNRKHHLSAGGQHKVNCGHFGAGNQESAGNL